MSRTENTETIRFCEHCRKKHGLGRYLPMTDFTACQICGQQYRCYPVPEAFRFEVERTLKSPTDWTWRSGKGWSKANPLPAVERTQPEFGPIEFRAGRALVVIHHGNKRPPRVEIRAHGKPRDLASCLLAAADEEEALLQARRDNLEKEAEHANT